MKKLHIAQIAPLWFPIPPQKYGGIEWIVYHLCQGLKKRGHQVTLFASGDSRVPCKLISVYPKSLIKAGISWRDQTYNILNLSEAFKRAGQFDIIHTHIDLWETYFPQLVKTPVVHTIHNPLYSSAKIDSRLFILEHFKKNNYVAISNAQRKLSRAKLNFVATVYNGVDLKDFKFNPKGGDHFVWAARIDKYKGIENAIVVAKKAGIKLLLAGRLDPAQVNYFKTVIKPQLNRQIQYFGEYNRYQKSWFFSRAKALLYLIEWHEPFGLIMAESLACGTPVIAFNRGSVPEVVEDGKTGFIVNNINEAVEAIKKLDQIDRYVCRQWVEKKFTVEKMVENYENVYYKLIKRQK